MIGLAFALAFVGTFGVIGAFIVVFGVLVFTVRRPWSADARYQRALEYSDMEAEIAEAEEICRKLELAIWNAGEKPNAGEEKDS